MTSKKPVIALAQIKYFDLNRAHNTQKIIKYIKIAKRAGADIVCFPESCLTKKGTLPINHKIINRIREECKKQSIWAIITEDIFFKGKPYNAALLINRKGKIKGWYQKINLFGDKVNPGRLVKVFKTDFGKIGMAICWDVSFPKLFKKMKDAGAEIVFCPSQWWYEAKAHDSIKKRKEREFHLLESLIMTRAFENLFFVALCNPVQDSEHQISYSAIASPHKILKRIVNKEGLITAEINLNEIGKLQKIYQ